MIDVERYIAPFRITSGKGFRLKDHDPGDTLGLDLKDQAKELLQRGVAELADQQEMLYAQDRWSVLVIFQAMDAAGKDGAIKHVMSGVNPQGVQVFSFKAPSAEDLDHDFLWRTTKSLPERGRIGIFNRSYYEEALVVRVHENLLAGQKLPPQLVTKNLWDQRFDSIKDFERHLARNGTVIIKFFLHVSRDEQLKRFLRRLDDPARNWKFSLADARERGHWDDYMDAYEDLIRNTSTEYAPWYVIPADQKWFTRLAVAATVVDTLQRLDLHFPKVDDAKKEELVQARAALLGNAAEPESTGPDPDESPSEDGGSGGGKKGKKKRDKGGKEKKDKGKKNKKDKKHKKNGKKGKDTAEAATAEPAE